MRGTSGIEGSEPWSDEELDPLAAVQLLERTRRSAEHDLDFRSPWLTAVAAVVVLVAFGAAWLSVLGQHPYQGPTWIALIVLWAVVLVRVVTVALAHRRARSGISGRTTRQQRAEAAVVVVVLLAVYAAMGALLLAGASDAIVYGLCVTTGTLVALGAVWAARSAVREDWVQLGTAFGIILVATVSAFTGPYDVWLYDGIGCCVVLLALSAAQAVRVRRGRSAA